MCVSFNLGEFTALPKKKKQDLRRKQAHRSRKCFFFQYFAYIYAWCSSWKKGKKGAEALSCLTPGKICHFGCWQLEWEKKGSPPSAIIHPCTLQKGRWLCKQHWTSEHKSTTISKKELNILLGKYWDVRFLGVQYNFCAWHTCLLVFRFTAFGKRISIKKYKYT